MKNFLVLCCAVAAVLCSSCEKQTVQAEGKGIQNFTAAFLVVNPNQTETIAAFYPEQESSKVPFRLLRIIANSKAGRIVDCSTPPVIRVKGSLQGLTLGKDGSPVVESLLLEDFRTDGPVLVFEGGKDCKTKNNRPVQIDVTVEYKFKE